MSADLPTPPPTSSAEKYAALLDEAASIRGISLWKDAWRRLRKNYAAMTSLYFLSGLVLLAWLTPLLPLQSPSFQLVNKENIYQPPRLLQRPLSISLDDLKKFDAEVAEISQQVAAAAGEEKEKLQGELQGKYRSHPFNRLWTTPGPVARLMIRTRLMIFGQWSIPSICGTDNLGRDVLSRIFWGARVSMMVGVLAAAVSLVIGVSYGAIAGYAGGIIDAGMMRGVDILYCIPFIFVVINLIMLLSDDEMKVRLARFGIDQIMIFYIVIGAVYWLTMSRVVRGQVISLKHEQFIDAARTIGAGSGRIVFRHIVPNVLGIVIVYLTLTIPSVMLFEAFLSFLGLGVQPPDVSWGMLVNEGIKVITPIGIHWWLVLFPGLALALTLFALNFLGDGLRDALDPRMKNR
jgi:oligopeptide transport system permease protein